MLCRALAILAVAGPLLCGCQFKMQIGPLEPTEDTSETAKPLGHRFNARVDPALQARCSRKPCEI